MVCSSELYTLAYSDAASNQPRFITVLKPTK